MSKFGFDRVKKNMAQVRAELPPVLGSTAQNFFLSSFRYQGFEEGAQKWKEVKRRMPDQPEYKYPKKKGLSRRTKPILSMTGRLRRAVSTSLREATWKIIRFVVDVPYAEYLNEGTDKMAKRQYIGKSEILDKKIKEKIEKVVNGIWQG